MNYGQLIEKVYEALGFVKIRSLATGGSATTIVDTSLATKYGTNAFRNHIFFISKTTDGASPQNKFGLLPAANYTASTQTFTIPTVTDAVGAGDEYVIAKPTLELYEVQSQINLAMGMLPPVRLVNASLSSAANTLEYTLPIATKGYRIQEVRVGNATDGWENMKGLWEIVPAAGGSTETLRFLQQPTESETIQLVYLGKQTTLATYSDTISEKYPDELVYSVCFYTALKYYMIKKGFMLNRRWTPILQEAEKRYNRATAENPIRTPPADRQRTYLLGRMP